MNHYACSTERKKNSDNQEEKKSYVTVSNQCLINESKIIFPEIRFTISKMYLRNISSVLHNTVLRHLIHYIVLPVEPYSQCSVIRFLWNQISRLYILYAFV